MKTIAKILILATGLLLASPGGTPLHAQQPYTTDRPLIIACDWDRPPFEYRNDYSQPAGFYVDVMTAILDEMGVPYKFQMQEWAKATESFEQGKADLMLGNVRKYKNGSYACTSNIISYYRVSVATRPDTTGIISLKMLENSDEVVFCQGNYAALFFKEETQGQVELNYRSPKEALSGIVKGDYKYFVWGEEPLKWKIKEFNFQDDISLHEVSIPLGEIHIIGHDRKLIDAIDDQYSRLKQSGEIDRLHDKWFHPERIHNDTSPVAIYITLGLLVLAVIIWLVSRLAKAHVNSITRTSTDISQMMTKALHMGNFHVMEYDIKKNLMTNHHGSLLPAGGITLEQFTARIHPDEQAEFSQKMKLLLGGRERKFEIVKWWNAGTEEEPQWLRFNGHAIVELDQYGHPAYVINAIHDITQNVEEDQENRHIEHRFDQLFNMPDLAISFYSQDGWLIELNEQMKELCGFENPDNERFWRTMNMYDVPLFRDAYPPEQKERDLQVCQIMDYPELGIKNYIEFHVIPIRNEQGEVTQFLDTSINLSDEHSVYADIAGKEHTLAQTRRQIEQHEQRLHHLLTGSNIYIYDIELATRTMTFSHSLSKTEYTITIDDYISMVDDKEQDEATEQFTVYDSLVILNRHFKRTWFSPEPQWICYIGRKRFDDEGRHIGFTGIAAVVTSLYEAQRRLHETTEVANDSIRLKNAFFASMTHELRTPLNAIVGFTTILDSVGTPEERKEYIDIIHGSCDMLQRLINDILEASSITTNGPSTIKPEDVDFVRSFDAICLTLQHRVKGASLEFLTENPYENFFTTIDIERIQQIVTNFVANSVKFTQQGHIKIGYRYERGGLYIYCEDTGAGIPKDKQDIIFERFVKLDEFIQGTGMGLTICKYITERLGGEIGVQSEGEGKGSTFWIWVPCERRLTKTIEVRGER